MLYLAINILKKERRFFMRSNIVERIKQVMDLREMQVIAPLIENDELIQSVISWMCDEESKAAFEKELAFHALHQLTNENTAIHYAGNMPLKVWHEKVNLAKQMHLAGKLPEIEMGTCIEYIKYYIYATTFLLEQYKYAPHVAISKNTNNNKGDVVLDCGACFGETSIWSAMQGASKIYAFDPSPNNIASCKANIKAHKLQNKIEVIPFALGKEAGETLFQQNIDNPGASRLSPHSKANESTPVSITTLDIWCTENNVKPDFIKMDIEGAETDAIIGAQNVIREHKPRFAICLYHNMSDLWNIPYLIKQICPEYKLWCRKNAHVGEFVLYGKV